MVNQWTDPAHAADYFTLRSWRAPSNEHFLNYNVKQSYVYLFKDFRSIKPF